MHWFFVVLLLVAQQGAFVHAAWHAHEGTPAHHEKQQGDDSFQSELCTLHGLLSQVLGGTETADFCHAVSPATAETISYVPAARPLLDLLVPFSRAPPVLR